MYAGTPTKAPTSLGFLLRYIPGHSNTIDEYFIPFRIEIVLQHLIMDNQVDEALSPNNYHRIIHVHL